MSDPQRFKKGSPVEVHWVLGQQHGSGGISARCKLDLLQPRDEARRRVAIKAASRPCRNLHTTRTAVTQLELKCCSTCLSKPSQSHSKASVAGSGSANAAILRAVSRDLPS